MKQIEEAAREWANSKSAGDNFASAHGDFLAGARYVLDQLMSEKAIQAFADAVEVMDDQDIDATPMEEIATALCAVRKEIEG